MKRYRVFYNENKVTGIVENDTSFTYTADNVIVGTIAQIGVSLRTIGVDTEMLDEYERIIEQGDKYQYIIIPTDLIPAITGMAAFVRDILPQMAFTVYLGSESITNRDGENRTLKTLPVDFTPCSIEKWEDGDDALLQGIIDQFNELFDPPRRIDFRCKFDSLVDLENFKASQQ